MIADPLDDLDDVPGYSATNARSSSRDRHGGPQSLAAALDDPSDGESLDRRDSLETEHPLKRSQLALAFEHSAHDGAFGRGVGGFAHRARI